MKFQSGDLALLLDGKGRRYLITLKTDAYFHSHHGRVSHNDVIDSEPGGMVRSEMDRKLTIIRPTYVDYVLKMPRGAQVIYPKDAATIVMFGDIFPGATVVEAGAGSGALTIALLRAVGAKGRVISFEIREDFHRVARTNIERFCPDLMSSLDLRHGDLLAASADCEADRIVLDFAEPWEALKTAEEWLSPGGIFTSYMPTVTQVVRLAEALSEGPWGGVQTSETLRRTWKVEGLSVRPDHRMVAHTAFITTARLMQK